MTHTFDLDSLVELCRRTHKDSSGGAGRIFVSPACTFYRCYSEIAQTVSAKSLSSHDGRHEIQQTVSVKSLSLPAPIVSHMSACTVQGRTDGPSPDTLEVCGRRAFGRTLAFADVRPRPRRRSAGADAPFSRDFNRRCGCAPSTKHAGNDKLPAGGASLPKDAIACRPRKS